MLEINPNHIDAIFNKGFALARLGKQEEAIVCYEKVLEINPNHVNALSNKGVALGFLDKYEEAVVCYDRALEISPNNSDIIANLVALKVSTELKY